MTCESDGFVDLTQDEAGVVDLSRLSSSGDEDDAPQLKDREGASRSHPTLSLHRGTAAIGELLAIDRNLRSKLLQNYGQSQEKADSLENVRLQTGGNSSAASSHEDDRSSDTSRNPKEARMKANELKQIRSERYALKFIRVIMTPDLMENAVGLAIAQMFQQTSEKSDRERINYSIEACVNGYDSYPAIRWKRFVPSDEEEGVIEEVDEPFTMICVEGSRVIDWIESGVLDRVLNKTSVGHKVYLLTHRLEHTVRKREIQDHREAFKEGKNCSFNGEHIRQVLASLPIERPHVEVFDANTVGEASSHVASLTRAISLRHCKDQDCSSKSKYISTKARKNGSGAALATLLVKDPLPKEQACLVKALTAIPSVTPQIAHCLVKEFGLLGNIYEMIDDDPTDLESKTRRIENLLTHGGRRVGPKAARRLIDFLLCEDPQSKLG
jgi:hypothetical protein